MKFGVREIVDVVFKATADGQRIGTKTFKKYQPVFMIDTATTSSLEQATTTVYAQGGKGYARLIAWEGEKTMTFTVTDALMSPMGLTVLSGAGLIDASATKPVYQHVTETIDASFVQVGENSISISLSQKPYLPNNKNDNFAYVMFKKNGDIVSEPYIPVHETPALGEDGMYAITVTAHPTYQTVDDDEEPNTYEVTDLPSALDFDSVLVDYYVEQVSDAQQIDITPDKFGGNYYLEASTLFRTQEGVDMPAEFIIPNCKIQSNFTFTMASSGDPSTFTFTMDAFPDYTRFDHSKKVLAAIQIISGIDRDTIIRHSTSHETAHDLLDI